MKNLEMLRFVCVTSLIIAPTFTVSAQTTQPTNYDSVGIESLPSMLRGNSECFADLDLAFAVSGVVDVVSVQEGDSVQIGAALMSLDQRSEAIEAERRKLIWLDRSELESAQLKAEVTQQQFAAAKRLESTGGAISAEDVQNRKLAADIDAAEVRRLQSLEAIQELDFKSAEDSRAKRTMRAPSNGIVSEVIKKSGESAQAYEPIIKLCDMQKIIFSANFPDATTSTLNVGDLVTLQFTNAAETIQGRVRLISPVVDAATGLRKVKIDLPDGIAWLRPGLTADLLIEP